MIIIGDPEEECPDCNIQRTTHEFNQHLYTGRIPLLASQEAKIGCTTKTCSPLNLTILKTNITFWTKGHQGELSFDQEGANLGVPLVIIKKTQRAKVQVSPMSQSRFFKSFNKYFNPKEPKVQIPPMSAKNLFI